MSYGFNLMATPHNAVVLAAATVVTKGNLVKVDMSSRVRTSAEFNIILKTVTDASTAPGSSKTVQVHYFWSDVDLDTLADATVILQLADRRVDLTAEALTNSVATTQYFESGSEVRAKAKFLYLAITTTSNTGAVTITTELRRVPSVDRD